MARHIVIGTAGHVDHGKTTLVKALTGIDTDTTAEEKKRGLTINLGFAYLDLPNHTRVGIVDVPGHERFIKNMVAGLPGINMVLLVIDANEGVMPQTREHLDILTLLGVRNFLIVLTKIDTVDRELRELAVEDIREQMAHTAAAHADIVETDAVTGQGIPELIQKIQAMAGKISDAADNDAARLNIDRVFSIKGFGTIVTGTLLDGRVSVGNELWAYPGSFRVRVRNIQVHEQNESVAEPGQRTALNLANVSKEQLVRGDVLCASGDLKPAWMLDVKIRCLDHSPVPVRLWDRLRLLVGTREVMVRAVPMGTDQIQPGEEGFLQLRMEQEQIIVKARDRFILRTFSPMHTIAGGEILDANPGKHRRFRADVLERLKAQEDGNTDELVADFLRHTAPLFTTKETLSSYTRLLEQDIDAALEQLVTVGIIRKTALGYMHERVYGNWRARALQLLLEYHKKYPLRKGMPVGEFRARLSREMPEKELTGLLCILADDGICRMENHAIAASHFHIFFTPSQKQARQKVEETLDRSGYTPVKISELLSLDAQAAAVIDAIKDDTVLFLTSEYIISRIWYERAVRLVCRYVQERGTIELAGFRDSIQAGRKASLLLLDYMDAQHITKRVGNYRTLDSRAGIYQGSDIEKEV